MKISVKAPYTYGEDITVQILGDQGELLECNHAGAYQEELDYGYADSNICDWRDDWRNSLVCDKCDWSEMIEPEEPDYDMDEY